MDTCVEDTPRKKISAKVMRLRPVLDHRMPTLVTKAAFMPKSETQSAFPGAQGRHPEGLLRLQGAPPRSMRDVRAAVTKELKSLTRKLARLEREYYGERGAVQKEVEKYAQPVKKLMKTLWILDLNKASAVEEMLRQASNPDRYKGDPKLPAALKEVFSKIQSFLPDRISVLVEACQGLLNQINRYCVSFYEADTDCYLETPAHYSEQMAVWKAKVEQDILAARALYRRFCTSGITIGMLSPPVATFCSRADVTKLLFLVMFADACMHIRSALSVLTLWLKTDETYAGFVKNDLAELEKLKEEKMKTLREGRQRCHSLTYSLTKQEADHNRFSREVENMREKENVLRIEEVFLVNALDDMDLEIEFKEKRRDNLRRRSSSEHLESSAETLESLASELKTLKERHPGVLRSLGQVRSKLAQVDAKLEMLDKVRKDMEATQRDLRVAEEERNAKEQDFSETEEAAQLARKILLCKTASDATEKLYYSVPFGTKTTKGENKDPVSHACKLISARIDKDWVSLYRHLPFHPPRGQETVERDIVELRDLGARASQAHTSGHALERWRRHHTRANVEDLRQALRRVRRLDILRVIDDGFKAAVKEEDEAEGDALFEAEEELAPPVKPELLPFYRLVERYDQLRASKVKQ